MTTDRWNNKDDAEGVSAEVDDMKYYYTPRCGSLRMIRLSSENFYALCNANGNGVAGL
jgi:hypothetical protein